METKQIKIHISTWSRLHDLKIHPRETMDDVVCRLIGFKEHRGDWGWLKRERNLP